MCRCGVSREIVGEKFERSEAAELQILGLIDDAHSAAAEFFENAIEKKTCPRSDCDSAIDGPS
jgi:hypothetical protein